MLSGEGPDGGEIAPQREVGAAPPPSMLRASISFLAPWGALFALCLLYELPFILRARAPDLTEGGLTLEIPLLCTCWALNEATYAVRSVRVLFAATAVALVVLRLDQWICLALMDEAPLLYDQWFMLRHLLVLVSDLMSPRTVLVLIAAGIASALTFWLVRRLLTVARGVFAPSQSGSSARVAVALWALFTVLAARDAGAHFLTPALIDNLRSSYAVYRSVSTHLTESPYAAYDDLTLAHRPDVLLFIVESYGKLLSVEPGMRDGHEGLLAELERQLAASGFHAVSAFSTSTVSGGRSWIAEGTMLMGTKIRYEAVFQHMIAARPRSLVGFLTRQGYDTVLLAPADRDRPGARLVNRYGFTNILAFDQLAYRGPAIGWGIVPDEYSLQFAEQRVLRAAQKPVFLDFHMVSSHAPWEDVPVLSAQAGAAAPDDAPLLPPDDGVGTVMTRLGRYDRPKEQRYPWMGDFDARMRRGYRETITYDLRVIARYLTQRADDALVIVMGDHQPPVIARGDRSFDTPIHVLSRDPSLLAPLERAGFVGGLSVADSAAPVMSHAGLFSLVVHLLCAEACEGRAPLLREGRAAIGR